jgi:hypothetical protein
MSIRRLLVVIAWIGLTLASACATAGARTSRPASESDALFHAALSHASPDRPTYDPDRAADLLATFIERFPDDARRGDAADRLALLNEIRALRAELRALKAIDLARPPR